MSQGKNEFHNHNNNHVGDNQTEGTKINGDDVSGTYQEVDESNEMDNIIINNVVCHKYLESFHDQRQDIDVVSESNDHHGLEYKDQAVDRFKSKAVENIQLPERYNTKTHSNVTDTLERKTSNEFGIRKMRETNDLVNEKNFGRISDDLSGKDHPRVIYMSNQEDNTPAINPISSINHDRTYEALAEVIPASEENSPIIMAIAVTEVDEYTQQVNPNNNTDDTNKNVVSSWNYLFVFLLL